MFGELLGEEIVVVHLDLESFPALSTVVHCLVLIPSP